MQEIIGVDSFGVALLWYMGGSCPRGFGLAVASFSIPGAYNNLPSALRHCWDG